MSKYTDFLNLFEWEADKDSEEEFDIDKALNENWEKVDTKLKTHINNITTKVDEFETNINTDISNFETTFNTEIEQFKQTTNENLENFQTEMKSTQSTYEANINDKVDELEDTVNSAQIFHKYTLIITTSITSEQPVTLPCYYKVGSNVLDVYFNGERLFLSSDSTGTDGHYQEVGDEGAISNTISITSDWTVEAGDYFEFVVRGEYTSET